MQIIYKGVTKECKYYKGLKWDKALTPKMQEFEKETGKNAIFRGVVTGTFEYWMYWRKDKTPKKTTSKKPAKKKAPAKKTTIKKKPYEGSIQGGYNELMNSPVWLSKLPKEKRKFENELERPTGIFQYYRTYPESKKQNAYNLKIKLESKDHKAIIKTAVFDEIKIFRVYKSRKKFVKQKGMKMKDIQRKPQRSAALKYEEQIEATHKRYLELKKMNKADLQRKYKLIRIIKNKEDADKLDKQTLILNILYSEVGSSRYGNWHKEYISVKPFPTKSKEKKYNWNIKKNWRSITIDLGKTSGGYKGKVYITRQDFKDHHVYNVHYSLYGDKENRWLSYSEHTFKRDKPEDNKIIQTVIDNNPMVR